MSNDDPATPLRRAAAQFEAAIQDARQATTTATESLRRLRATDPTTTREYQELEKKVAERFRSGKYGPEIREMQTRIDRGESTWQQIRAGAGDENLARLYRDNQTTIFEAITEVRREAAGESKAGSRAPQPDDWDEPRTILKRRK
jgi:hypothetical protein